MKSNLSLSSLIASFVAQTNDFTVSDKNNRTVWEVSCPKTDELDRLFLEIKNYCSVVSTLELDFDEDNENGIEFKLTFGVDDYFYVNLLSFKKHIIVRKQFPNELYIFEERIHQKNIREIPKELIAIHAGFENIVEILASLERVAHYVGKNNEIVFIDPSEKSALTVTLSNSISSVLDMNLLDHSIEHHTLSCLIKNEDEENSFFLKEKAIFRASLFEFFKNKDISLVDSKKTTTMLLQKFSDFERLYSLNYESYVSGLSLNKLKLELAQEQLKFSDQAAKILADVTTKVIAFPALTVLITLARNNNMANPDLGAVLTFMTAIILICSIYSQYKQLEIIKEAKEISFGNIERKIKENHLEDTTKLLSKELNKLLNSLTFGLRLANITIIIYLVIILIILYFFI